MSRSARGMLHMQLKYQKFDLPLKHVFTISRGSVAVQETLDRAARGRWQIWLRRVDDEFVLRRDDPNMTSAIESVRSIVEERIARRSAAADRSDLAQSCRRRSTRSLRSTRSTRRFTICGASCAARRSIKLWGLTTDKIPMSDYTLGIDTPEKMVAKMNEMPGWPVYKIKLGTADDLGIVRELRKHTDALFRVDANCGWTAEQTIEFAPVLKEMGVEFIEQPLPPEDVDGARRAFEKSALPLIADENCVVGRRRRALRGHVSRHQHQAGEVRRPGGGAADGRAGPRAGPAR